MGDIGKPSTLYKPSYATIWSHDRPNDLAIGHDRPTYANRPYHTVQDYPQDEYDTGYPPLSVTSGVHAPIEDSSTNAVDYSRYRGNRMKNAHGDIVAPECRTRRIWSSAPKRRLVEISAIG